MFGEFEDHESMIFPWFILQDLPQTFHFHLGYGDSVAISSLCLNDFECGFLWISYDFLQFSCSTRPILMGGERLSQFDQATVDLNPST